MTAPFISVVVLAYRQFELTTGPCLASLRPWFDDEEIEFIVFDNASPDGSDAMAKHWCAQHPRLKFIQSERNLGYAGGMNVAVEHASGTWLFLVNNDTEFPALALDALKKVLKSAPEQTAMIGPVTNAAGNGQRLYDPSRNRPDWMAIGEWFHLHPTGQLLHTYRSDFFCVAVLRQTWKNLGGLDPVFGMGYFEDFDFSLRLRAAGFEQVITEDVFVYHQGSATFKSTDSIHRLMKKNKRMMLARHPQVKMTHVRLANLQAILDRLAIQPDLKSTPLAEQDLRLKLRIRALELDQPKSFFKRMLWKMKIRPLMETFSKC